MFAHLKIKFWETFKGHFVCYRLLLTTNTTGVKFVHTTMETSTADLAEKVEQVGEKLLDLIQRAKREDPGEVITNPGSHFGL